MGNGAWWLEHGLDGVVSGIIGGIFTALAVVLTIRHERGRVRRDELLRAVIELNNTATRLSVTLQQVQSVSEEMDWLMTMQGPLSTAHALAVFDAPALAEELFEANNALFTLVGPTWDRTKANQLARDLSVCAWAWLAHPRRFRAVSAGPLRAWHEWDELAGTTRRTEPTSMRPWTEPEAAVPPHSMDRAYIAPVATLFKFLRDRLLTRNWRQEWLGERTKSLRD